MERTTSRRKGQIVSQAEDTILSNLEMYPSPRPQVVYSPIEHQTMGLMSIIYPPPHDTRIMGPPGYINYPAGVPSSYVESEGGLYGY